MKVIRNILLALLAGWFVPASAQQEVKIADHRALDRAGDVRKHKAVAGMLVTQGFSQEEVDVVMQSGDLERWPSGIRTQAARDTNAPYIINYVGFRLGSFLQDSSMMAVVMIPARNNIHMPEGLRPEGDFYLVLPDRALRQVETAKRMPEVSRGPRWRKRAKVKIIKPDDLYATYDLAADSNGLRALAKAGMSGPEIDAVIFRSTQRNWPDGIDDFEERYPLLEKFTKYRAWLGASWDDKALLIIPVEKNRRMPANMRPYLDLYFVYALPAVRVRGRR